MKAKFEAHLDGINLLNGDISALQAALPSCGSSGASQSSAAGQLRQLMENVSCCLKINVFSYRFKFLLSGGRSQS